MPVLTAHSYAATQTHLIAPNLLRHKVQRLYNPQPQLLPLLIPRDCNVLNVSHTAQVVNKLPLHHQCACADNLVGAVQHNQDKVRFPL